MSWLIRLLASLFREPIIPQKTTPKIQEIARPKIEEETLYKFSKQSLEKLETCHPDLQKLFGKVLESGLFDLTVVEGVRTLERQKQLVAEGKSKTLNSKHLDGSAVDVAIYKNGKIDWDDSKAYYVLAGIVYTLAKQEGISVRWGGNWECNQDYDDTTFLDLVHWEIL